tara:strand:- start:378 stop:605 length:228 start_codon:yes stop_codon:yes gene_type:complete
MVRDNEPDIKPITMTAEDMLNICLLVLENTAAGLFMTVYNKQPLEPQETKEVAQKLRDIVIKLRELFSSGKLGGL